VISNVPKYFGRWIKKWIKLPGPKLSRIEQRISNCLTTFCAAFRWLAQPAFERQAERFRSARACAELRSFAPKTCRAVENDRERFGLAISSVLHSPGEERFPRSRVGPDISGRVRSALPRAGARGMLREHASRSKNILDIHKMISKGSRLIRTGEAVLEQGAAGRSLK